MMSVPRMVHELPPDDHFTQHDGKLFLVFPLFQNEPELPLRLPPLPPLTKSLVHAVRARPSRATRYSLQDRYKRDVVRHAPTQPRPWESQRGQALVVFALIFTLMMFVLAAVSSSPS